MPKFKLEYIWLDGYEPVPNLRGKTKIEEFERFPTLDELPLWGFDGSSTRQAEGSDSDCMLHPGRRLPRPGPRRTARSSCARCCCPDGTPHPSNSRATIPDDPDTWFGFEQEYFLYEDGAPLGFPPRAASRRRRASTTRASATRTSARSRARSSRSISTSASRPASTTRASTPRSPRASGSSRSSARARGGPPTRCGSRATCSCASARRYGVDVNWHSKPLGAEVDWNGSGMHTNFSTQVHARGRRRGVLRGADGRLRAATWRSTSRCTAPTTTCG